MKRSHALQRRSTRLPRLRPLLASIAAALMATPTFNALAVDLINGESVTVGAGSPFEGQPFTLGNSASLTVQGATVGQISSQNSTVVLDGATTAGIVAQDTRVDIRNSRPRSISTGANLSNPEFSDRSVVNIRDSQVHNTVGSAAVSVSGSGSVFADNTAFSGRDMGIRFLAGIMELRGGSSSVGGQNGIFSAMYIGRQPGMGPDGWYVLIDRSHVEGLAGSALYVSHLRSPPVTRFIVQNGATLVGGNGNLFETDPGALFDLIARTSTLTGNFVVGDGAVGTLRFLDGLDLTGRVLGPADVIVDQGGRWTLSGDSNTGNLTLGAGSDIFLGAAGQAAYPQLTVNGNYTGQGGTLHFNTVLAGDDAASSSMIVSGDTSGSTNVSVSNINGAGAQTVNGIRLVQVGGASNGTFALQGRAVGGMYEYFLRKGTPTAANGNWYLTSAYTGDPCDINPALPQCPVDPVDPVNPVDPIDPIVDPIPVLRPESGAYLANQAAAQQMFTLRRHDRGEPGFDRASPGTWVRVGRDQLQASIAGQVDARTHINTVQLGSDLWRWGEGRGQLGVMLGTGDATTQAVSSLSGYGTRGKVKGKSAGVYAGWVQDAQSSAGAYVDGWVQAGRFDNDVQGEGLEREQYDSRTRSASLEAGYAFTLRSSASSTLYLQPQAQVTWSDYDGDRHVEANGTTVEDGRSGGVNSRVGMRLFGQSTRVGNRVQPFLGVNWLRGERDPSLRFNAEQLHAKLPQNRYEAQAGAQLQLGQRWTAWGDLRVQRGDGGYRDNGAQMGLRAAW